MQAVLRELTVWLRLKHPNIVPLLGTARVGSPLLALVYPWMPSGTLSDYLEQATTITPSARSGLVSHLFAAVVISERYIKSLILALLGWEHRRGPWLSFVVFYHITISLLMPTSSRE